MIATVVRFNFKGFRKLTDEVYVQRSRCVNYCRMQSNFPGNDTTHRSSVWGNSVITFRDVIHDVWLNRTYM